MRPSGWITAAVAALAVAAPVAAAEPAAPPAPAAPAAPCPPSPCPPGTIPYSSNLPSDLPGQGAVDRLPGGAGPLDGGGLFSAAPRGTGESRSFNPTMFGDLSAAQTRGPLTATLPGGQVVVLTRGQPLPAIVQQPGTRFNFDIFTTNGVVPTNTPYPAGTPFPPGPLPPGIAPASGVLAQVARGAFKIAENESPRPLNRVYGLYNFFYDVNSSLNTSGQTTNVHREVFGFEVTFLDGNASFGMRQPGVQVTGSPDVNKSGFGDLTFVFKYAFYNDLETGNLASVGLNVTAPSGASFLPKGVPEINSTVLQPWVGGIYNRGNWYFQGFSSIAVPTDSRDVTLWFNDIGVGYFLLRDRPGFVNYLAPTFEAHLTTPLDNRGLLRDPVGGIDILNFTYGVSTGLGKRAFLNVGVGHPVTGPRPFALETLAQLNLTF